MRHHRSPILLSILALLIVAASACQQPTPAPAPQPTKEAPKVAPINVGLWAALSGSQADLGTMSRNGAQMAVEDVNARGGIEALGGAKLNLVVSDITSDATQVPQVIERTLAQNKIAGAIGAGASQFTLSALPVMERRGVPMITTSISDVITQQGYSYLFQIAPKASVFGATQVEFLSFLKKKYSIPVAKVGFIYENTAYGTSTAGGLRKIAEQQGFSVVIDQPYPAGFADATSLVKAVKSSGAEVVFPVSYTVDGTLIVSTMRQMSYQPVIVGGGAAFIWPELQKSLGDKVNGIFSVGSWSWDSKNITSDPQKVEVTKRYKEKYGGYMPEQAGEHYAAIWVLKDAMEAAASAEPAKVREALSKIKITAGPATIMQPGVIQFDETGMSKEVFPTVIQWQKGEPHTVYPEKVQNVEVAWPGT